MHLSPSSRESPPPATVLQPDNVELKKREFKYDQSNEAGLTKELILQVRKVIGPFAAPKRIYIVADLPKTRSGKVRPLTVSSWLQQLTLAIGTDHAQDYAQDRRRRRRPARRSQHAGRACRRRPNQGCCRAQPVTCSTKDHFPFLFAPRTRARPFCSFTGRGLRVGILVCT
jgi:hypothetical protein